MFAKKALLVDDSRSARFVLGKLLKAHDYNVEMVGSAEEALEFLKKQRPDAIFMDYQMPGMSGLEATAQIKKDPATADIPVVMCSANEEHKFRSEVEASGALGILPKPPTKEKLDEILSSVSHSLESHKSGEQDSELASVTPLHSAGGVRSPQGSGMEDVEALVVERIERAAGEVFEPLIERRLEERLRAVVAQWDKTLQGFQEQMKGQLQEVLDNAAAQRDEEGDLTATLEALERRILEETEERMQELRGRLIVDFTSDPQVFRQLREVAEGAAQMISREAAADVSHKVAVNTAQEVVDAATEDQLTLFYGDIQDVKSSLQKLIYLFAGGASLIGVAAGALAWFFSA